MVSIHFLTQGCDFQAVPFFLPSIHTRRNGSPCHGYRLAWTAGLPALGFAASLFVSPFASAMSTDMDL